MPNRRRQSMRPRAPKTPRLRGMALHLLPEEHARLMAIVNHTGLSVSLVIRSAVNLLFGRPVLGVQYAVDSRRRGPMVGGRRTLDSPITRSTSA